MSEPPLSFGGTRFWRAPMPSIHEQVATSLGDMIDRAAEQGCIIDGGDVAFDGSGTFIAQLRVVDPALHLLATTRLPEEEARWC